MKKLRRADGYSEAAVTLFCVCLTTSYSSPDIACKLHGMHALLKICTPWNKSTVVALNKYQAHGKFHPFTCPHEHAAGTSESGVVLVATLEGWKCPVYGCLYEQTWAWDWMTWPEYLEKV